MPGPLDGIRVVDLSTMISGPLGAMILADQGADVIKVEPPKGDGTRGVATRRSGLSASFLNNNRNKRSLVLDLKQPDARDALFKVMAGADVVLQNFRPGVADRLGIGYDAVRAIKEDIVYASISGFGETGPYAHKPVFDPLIQSLSGLTTVQAGSDERRPALIRTILPDKLTGFTVAQAITAALFARERSGRGQHIRLSMLDTVIHFLWSSDMGGHTFVGNELQSETAQSFIDLIYESADGYISVAAFRREDWVKLADAVERPDWKDDERFLTSAGLEEHKPARLEMTQEALKTRTTAEWVERLDRFDVPHAPVLTRRDMIRHPQIAANALIVEHEHPTAGPLRQTRPPALFSDTAPEHRMGGAVVGRTHARRTGRGRCCRRHHRPTDRKRCCHHCPTPRGCRMIDFYYWPTPNGWKIAMLLGELGVEYRTIPVNIGRGEQFEPAFLKISPNNRMPAIVDHDTGGDPVSVFESGAILWYLADKHRQFLPDDPLLRKEVMEWLFWQVGGQGPMAGQLSHFVNYAPEDERSYGQRRYKGEYERLAQVLENRLDGRDWLVGDAYSIADMICWPWILIAKPLGVDLAPFPRVSAWRSRIKDRPATRAAVDLGRDFDKGPALTAEERERLYFQTASSLKT